MKNILVALSLISIFSCQEKKKEYNSENSIIKEKKIEKRDEVVIYVNDTVKTFFTNLFVNEMQDKPDMIYLGQKENRISVTIPTQNSIRIVGGAPFFSFFYELQLEKGDSLLIDIEKVEVNPSQQIRYPIFTLLNSDKTWSETNFDYLLYKRNINSRAIVPDENDFQNNKYDSEKVYQNSIELLDSLKLANSISDKFYSTNKITRRLKFATAKIREAKNQNLEIDIEELGIKLNEEELLGYNEYVSFLRTLILYKFFNEEKRVKNSVLFDFVNEHDTLFNESSKEVLLDSYLKSIFFIEKSQFDKYLKKFSAINGNDEFQYKWNAVVQEQKVNSKKLNKTNRTVGILTNLINDNEFTFEEVLSRHKGKVVLVDFWASWCAPCRKEMPFLEKLKLQFDETELKIIEISIDKDYSAWLRASKLENLSNEIDNYIISNWEKSKLYKNYNINTIPRYLLFGKDGKLIDQNAPRPSEKELIELIQASI